jgi:uncharacterized protein YjiS (DUF1127 family)
MSCGSTACNSTNILDAASTSYPDPGGSWKTLLSSLTGIALWWERRSQYRQLLELDDRLLTDIGVSRMAAEEARRSRLYLLAWRDSK